jgi:hypothetical protein
VGSWSLEVSEYLALRISALIGKQRENFVTIVYETYLNLVHK